MFTSHHHELEVEAEAREQAKLDGMRARRAERVDRLMNARERTSGRDDAAREWQVAEREKKLAQEAEERKRDYEEAAQYRDMAVSIDRSTAAAKAAAVAALRRDLDSQIAAASARTTADLEGKAPGSVATRPVRQDGDAYGLDPDPRLGVSSAQVFDGEDPLARQRARLQAAQLAVWTSAALAEKEAAKAAAERERREYESYRSDMSAMAHELDSEAVKLRRAMEAATLAANKAAAASKLTVKAEEREREKNADVRTLDTLNSKGVGAGYHFLAGDREDGVAAFSSTRYRVDHYRGAGPEVAASTLGFVAGQIADKRAAVAAAREQEAVEAEENRRIIARARALDRETEAARAASKRDALAVLQRQAGEAAERRRRETDERKGLRISDDFFGRFGTSDR